MVNQDQDEILVAQWLYDKKYFSALVALENDANFSLHESTSQLRLIKKLCLDGDFDGLQILMVKMFTEPHLSLFRFAIRRHELQEYLSAIKSRNDVEVFVDELQKSKSLLGSELISQFESALMMPDPMRHELYSGWTKVKGRYELFEAMLPVLRRVFPDQSYSMRLSESAPSNPLERIISNFRTRHTAEYDSYFHGPKFSTPIESPAPIAVTVAEIPPVPSIKPSYQEPSPPSPPPVSKNEQTLTTSLPSLHFSRRYKDDSGSPIRVACFSPDGKRIAIGTNNQSLVFCDITSSISPPNLPVTRRVEKLHAGSVYSIAWSYSLIATGSNDQTIKLTPEDAKARSGARIKVQAGTIRGLDFHPVHTMLYAGSSGDAIVRQIDPIKGTIVSKYSCAPPSLNDSSFINSVSASEHQVVVCALSNGAVVAIDDRCSSAGWRISSGNTSAVAHCRGKFIAVGTESGNVSLYDIRQESVPLWTAKTAHSGACRSVSLSHSLNDPIVASASFDKKIKIWKNSETVTILEDQHTDRVVHVDWSPNGSLVSCGTDSTVLLWVDG